MKLFAKIVDRYAIWILLAVLAITLAMVPGLKKITIARGFDHDVFPEFNELVTSVKTVRKTFGANIRQVIISVETRGERHVTDPHVLRLITQIAQSLKTVPLIKSDSLLSIASVKDFITNEDGFSTELLIQKLPANDAESKELERKIEKNPFFYGRLVSKDFKSAIIIATTYDNADLADIHNQVLKVILPYKGAVPATTVTLVGEPEVNYQVFTSIEKDVLLFVVIGIALILLSFFLMFQSWHGVLLPLCGILTGIIWTMGIIGYHGDPITLISATLPVVLVVMGSETALHVFHNLLEQTDRGVSFEKALASVLQRLFFPLSMATVTAFIGGVSLVTFKIYPIQHFGIFTGIGALISMFVSMVMIPSFFKVLHKPIEEIEDTVTESFEHVLSLAQQTLHRVPVAGPVTGALAETVTESIKGGVVGGWEGFWKGIKRGQLTERGLKGISNLVNRHSVLVLLTVPVVLILSATQIPKIQIGFDNISFLPEGSPVRAAVYRLDEAFGGTQKFDLLLDTQNPKGVLDPEFLKKTTVFEEEAKKIQGITYTFSVVHLLKKLHSLLQPDAREDLPANADAISQYLFLLSMSQTGIPLSSLVTTDHQKIKVTLNIMAHDTRDASMIYDQLVNLAHRVYDGKVKAVVGGDLVYSIAMTRYLVWGKIQNILVALLLMFVVISVVHRSLTNGLITTLALPIGVVLNFGLMGYSGIRLDFVTAIITSFAMGLGVGFAIHFIAGVKVLYKETRDISLAVEKAIQGPGKVIVYNCISNIVGFSVLLFSSFKAIHVFSILMAFNMVILLLSTLIVVPAVIRLFPPEFITHFRKMNNLRESRRRIAMKVALSSVAVLVLSIGIYWLDAKAMETKPVSADDLISKAIDRVYTVSEEATYVMKLIDGNGTETVRKMRVWYKRDSLDKAKLLIKLDEPADLRGTGMLSILEAGKSADQWLYLPAIKKARRIKGSNQDEAFLGSDFTVSDLSVDKQDRFEYKMQGARKCGEQECYVLVGGPKSGDVSNSPYSKKVIEIRKDNYMVVKTEFYNQAGQLEKVMTLQGIHKAGGKHWMANRLEMKNILANHSTVIEVQKRDISKEPANTIFTQNYLERN